MIQKQDIWGKPGQTQTAGTAIKIPIPPWPGPGSGTPFLYGVDSQNAPNWLKNQGGCKTVVTNYGVSAGSTAHIAYFMRPFNWAVVSVAGAINTTTFTVDKDPGLYGTAANWRWPTPQPAGVANNAMAGSDYFAVQLADGTWFFDIISSLSGLAITTTTTIPNVTGGGIPKGAIMFWFGIQTDLDPRLGAGSNHPSVNAPISAFTQFNNGDGLLTTIGAGEPMYYFNANATGADIVSNIGGYFGRL